MSETTTISLEPDRVRLRAVALRRLGLVPVGPGPATSAKKTVFFAELAKLGYEVTNPDSYRDSALAEYEGLVEVLKAMRGGDVDYVPLFAGFPNEVPRQDEYFIRRVIGYLGNLIGCFESGEELDNGVIVPNWLFNVSRFGADPITQFQDAALSERGVAEQAARDRDQHVKWIRLRLKDWPDAETECKQLLHNSLYAKSSIKESLKPDLEFLLERFGTSDIDTERVTFKETRTYLSRYCWERDNLDAVQSLCSTPVDVLRLFAAVTDTDVSLAESIRFPKLTRPQRRTVMSILEGCPNLLEDLLRHKGLWLAIGRFLHPGEMGKKFPQTSKAFDAIRNGTAVTFNSRMEAAASDGNTEELIRVLRQRPGVFARRLHHALELADDHFQSVLESFASVAHDVPLKSLLVLETLFKTTDESPTRAVINKRGRIRVMDSTRKKLGTDKKDAVLRVLREAITRRLSNDKSSWQGRSVWIDERLRTYTVPLQQRKASDGLLTIGRGTQLPLDPGNVLRLFVYWQEANQRTDLDLSLIKYDSEMQYRGHVSYTNLKSGGIVHSGDLQSAPQGAAEFIDVDLSTVRKDKDVRYIASQVYRYCGDPFGQMQCHTGWMIREKVNADYKSFDIQTVQNKFDLTGTCSYAIPLLIDLTSCRIIFVDIYVNGVGQYNRVEGAYQDVSTITREMARMVDTRPNLYDLALHHVRGRNGEVVNAREEADMTIGFGGCDLNALQIETVLSELL